MLSDARRRVLQRWHLDAWLTTATKGLADESYDRVREEIVDHFHEALDAGIARGLDPDDAAAAATESLGPARKARRKFRRTYLTKTQANLVRSFAAEPRPGRMPGWASRHSRLVLGLVVLFIVLVTSFVTPGAGPTSTADALCLIAVVTGIAILAVVPRIFARGHQRLAVILGSLGELLVWGGYFGSILDEGWAFPAALMTFLLGAILIGVIPVLPKLPRAAAGRDRS